MLESLDSLPLEEISDRVACLQNNLKKEYPGCSGALIFSRMNMYYYSGSWINGVLYIPIEEKPVLMVRRGLERAALESGLDNQVAFRSFRELPKILSDFGLQFSGEIAAEKSALPWSMAEMLQKRVGDIRFVSAENALAATRAVKSEWELEKIKLAGERHHQALHDELPRLIHPGMTEREIALVLWDVFFRLGHHGHMRMQNFGEEIFLGHVSAGDSANYPSTFNGPVGIRGQHPAIPHMGYAGKVWQEDEPLVIDVGFCLEGYHTDKTQVYCPDGWSPPGEFERAQECCREIQEMLAGELKPGVIPSRLYEMAVSRAEEKGFSEGFMGLNMNKVQFVGHGIGLAIDEWPVLAAKFNTPLEKNTCLALEPKIGLFGVGMAGVENTFLIREDGGVSLTGQKFDPVMI